MRLRRDAEPMLKAPRKGSASPSTTVATGTTGAVGAGAEVAFTAPVIGDNAAAARAIAREVGIAGGADYVIAGVLPAEKVAVIRRLQDEGRVVATESATPRRWRGPTRELPWALAPTSPWRPAHHAGPRRPARRLDAVRLARSTPARDRIRLCGASRLGTGRCRCRLASSWRVRTNPKKPRLGGGGSDHDKSAGGES